MKILILNLILYTADHNRIPKVTSIKDTMIYNMCVGFKQSGHQVTLIAAQEYKPAGEESYDFDIIFVKSAFTKIFPPAVLPYCPELWNYLRKNKAGFDLIISSEVFALASLFAALICPRKTIIWHELTVHQQKFHQLPSRLWHHTIVPLCFRKIVSVVPRSQAAFEFISRYLKNVSTNIVDHGINIETFAFNLHKQQQFICVSQLIARKNVSGIIDKFTDFLKLGPYKNFKLYIAGRGDQKEALEQKVHASGLEEHIIFLGFLSHDKLNEYVGNSMGFLVNTKRDLNMVSIPEAIVCGTPVITNLVPASASYIKSNALGIAKEEWTAQDLVQLVENNSYYVANCGKYREKLTNFHSAQQLIEIFLKNK